MQFIRAWLVVLLQHPLAITLLVVWDTGEDSILFMPWLEVTRILILF